MKKYIAFLSFLVWFNLPVSAQKVLLAENVSADTVKKTFGPNLKYFGHFYAGFGFAASAAEGKGSEIKYFNSHEWVFGFRFKYKVSNLYALGFDVTLNPQTYYLKQHAGKTLPTPVQFDEEKFKFTNWGLSVYQRINYGKRGNYVGNFIDMGAYGNWMPIKAHIYEDDHLFGLVSPLDGVKKVKVRETGLKYMADFNYGVLARLGFNRYVLYGAYRLSDLFDSGYTTFDLNGNVLNNFAELPRLSVGFQVGIH